VHARGETERETAEQEAEQRRIEAGRHR
jgi:hypothetical protein